MSNGHLNGHPRFGPSNGHDAEQRTFTRNPQVTATDTSTDTTDTSSNGHHLPLYRGGGVHAGRPATHPNTPRSTRP